MGRITDAQVKELRRQLQGSSSLQRAALKTGMDRKSAAKYREGKMPRERRTARTWRTRLDPLAAVWPEVQAELERAPGLQALTLLTWLQERYPGQFGNELLRTLQRRVRRWRALAGPAKEVFFTQVHEPGRLGSSDFTYMNNLEVTIQGQRFDHLVYHFVLTYSNWEHVTICFSESFASLSEGLQNALWALGGVPQRHRTDRMTLAVHPDGNPEVFTRNYQALMGHYGLVAEATNPASGHENGDCEQGHRRFKEAAEQALLLRGSRDFGSREEYAAFLQTIQERRNVGRQPRQKEEGPRLGPLPARRLETLVRLRVKVGQGSTIKVQHNVYSVPSRLKGEWVEARVGTETIEVWYAQEFQMTAPRLRGNDKHRIDYRHVIDWLVRKPGAFARYCYQADLFPTSRFRQAYDELTRTQSERVASREYLEILLLAARGSESAVDGALARLLAPGGVISVAAVAALLRSDTDLSMTALVHVAAVDLRIYDEGGAAVAQLAGRGLSGPARECAGIRDGGFGEDAQPVCGGPGVGAARSAHPVHDDESAGAGSAQGQTRPGTEGIAQTTQPLGGLADRRPGLRAAGPGRDGGLVHAVGGALRARQCAGDEQPGLLAVGTDIQGPDDDSGGHRPVGPQRDPGTERAELPSRSGQESQAEPGRETELADRRGDREPAGAGEALFATAARPLIPLRVSALPQPPSVECLGRFDGQSVGISNCR